MNAVEPLHPKAYQVAEEVSRLGALVETYTTRVTREGHIFFWIIISILLPMISFIIWLMFFFAPFPDDSFRLSFAFWGFMVAVPMLFLSIILGVFFFILRTHDLLVTPVRQKITVSLHTHGFVYREGRKQQIVPWEQIRLVQRQTTRYYGKQRPLYVLQLQNEAKITLNIIIPDVQKLGDSIECAMAQLRLPSVLADYQANTPIIFPGLCLTHNYIYNSSEKLPWEWVGKITIGPERVVIREKNAADTWLDVPISQLPNLYLLEALLRYIQQE